MRKVKVKAHKSINVQKEYNGEALFHCWGNSFEEFENGPGNFTIAIVEDQTGKIWNVHSEDVQFLTPEETEANTEWISVKDRLPEGPKH